MNTIVMIAREPDRRTVDTATLAADYKARGMDNRRAWDQLIIDRSLNPGLDAGAFYAIYNRVTACRLPLHHQPVEFTPTHIMDMGGGLPTNRLMVTELPDGRTTWVGENGATGGNPPGMPLPAYVRPL